MMKKLLCYIIMTLITFLTIITLIGCANTEQAEIENSPDNKAAHLKDINKDTFTSDFESISNNTEEDTQSKGNIINSVGSGPEPEPFAVNKADLRGIAYKGSNLYVAIGYMGKILTSTDGLRWMVRQSGINKALWGVAWGEKQFVAVGDEGTILTSEDGINWLYVDSGINAGFMKVMWDGQQYITSGSGVAVTSADGTIWTSKEVPDIALNNGMGDKISYAIADIFWDGKQYIAAGGGEFILTSANLDKWAVRVPNSLGTGMFCDLAWNGKRYVAVGDHLAMMTSLNGRKWTNEGIRINKIDSVDDFYTLCLWSVVWGQDKFIAVGHRGLILTSVDGLDWSIIPPVTRSSLNQVIYDGRQYIAIGDNETVITSADGENWTAAFMEDFISLFE